MNAKLPAEFVHLHVHTLYSMLDGAVKIKPLIERCRQFGMPACAITDHGNMCGVIDFYEKFREAHIRPIIGCEFYIAPKKRTDFSARSQKEASYHLTLLAKNERGYASLLKLTSASYLEGFHYRPRIDKDILAENSDGLVALSGCLGGEIPQLLVRDDFDGALNVARAYREMFADGDYYIEIQDTGLSEQKKILPGLDRIAHELGLKTVATNDVHYLERDDAPAHDALLCINTGRLLDEKDRMRMDSDNYYLKSPDEMKALFGLYPQALKATLEIAEKCVVEIDINPAHYHLPHFRPPDGSSPEDFMRREAAAGLRRYYPEITDEIKKRFEYEFGVVKSMGFIDYYLIVFDFIKWARERGIPVGPGRGSGAGSILAYALGITRIDPLKYDLLFERFLNPERVSMPDFDIDFCVRRRNEVIDYVREKYGHDCVCQIATMGTLKTKAAIKDVGRVMNIPFSEMNVLTKKIPNDLAIKSVHDALEAEPELKSLYNKDPQKKQLFDTAAKLEGLCRQIGLHAAGVVISDIPLTARVPLLKAGDGQVATQYEMKCLELTGMLKMDFLGLQNLTTIEEALRLIDRHRGVKLDIDKIPLDDEKTYSLIGEGRTLGVFQLESEGMRNLIRQMKPDRFEDMIALVALYRPGPLGSGMVKQYVEVKHGRQEIPKVHKLFDPIVEPTYGLILYQEQVMKIGQVLGGFSLGEADMMRRAMGKKKPEILAEYREKFIEGAVKNGVPEKIAGKIFGDIEFFAGYGFNKSHSAAYGLIAYQTAWLKANYPVEYIAALMTSSAGDTDSIALYMAEAKDMGIEVLPPDVNISDADFTVDGDRIRFGLSAIKGVGDRAIETIIEAREKDGAFKTVYDYVERSGPQAINRKVLEMLTKSGAFDRLGGPRAAIFAAIDKLVEIGAAANRDRERGQASLFDDAAAEDDDTEQALPAVAPWDEPELLLFEKEALGFYLSSHPLARAAKKLDQFSTHRLANLDNLPDRQTVTVGGLFSKVAIRTTKRGDRFAQIVFEDLSGKRIAIAWPETYRTFQNLIEEDRVAFVVGKVDKTNEEPQIVIEKIFAEENAEEALAERMIVRVFSAETSAEAIAELHAVLLRYKGKCRVFLEVLSGPPAKIKTTMQAGPQFSVAPSRRLVEELETLFGPGSVTLHV